jgi:hypothetical protein
MMHRDVVDELLNQNRFADAGAAEKADFSTLQKRLDQVNYFDAGLEHLQSGGLIRQ